MGRKKKKMPPKGRSAAESNVPGDDQLGERLQKILARSGLGSRRACEDLIVEGRVRVNGLVVMELGTRADPVRSKITVDNKPIRRERVVYYLVNKPKGVICTMAGGAKGSRITDLVPKTVRVHPVGRLEVDSEGLMVLTNDGGLTHQLTHPSFGVSRVYSVEVDGEIGEEALGRLQRGVYLAEGKTMPAEIRVVQRTAKGGRIEVTIREGLNREIRRMLAAVGLKPRRIVRIRLGRLSLGDLPSGSYRAMDSEEIGKLRKGLSKVQKAPPAWIKRRRTRKGLPKMNAVPSGELKRMGLTPQQKRRVIGGGRGKPGAMKGAKKSARGPSKPR
jgi:pseudouridine synthase